MRKRQIVLFGILLFASICVYSLSRTAAALSSAIPRPPFTQRPPPTQKDDTTTTRPAVADPKPKPAPGGSHPIWHLINDAEKELEKVKGRQSRTLAEAVAEYKRRYALPPPPNFDKWWAFAKKRNVELVDEFDTVHELMTPFWGLKPATTRARAREALGFGNGLMGVQIRGGNVTHIDGANEWQMNATKGMMAPFVAWLPDMDLAFNIHDEPRVIVPHDDMVRLVEKAKGVNMPAANAVAAPRNGFTAKPRGLNDGTKFDETKLTRFNVFAHQPTWTHSRMSCPPDSPARALEEDERVDDVSRYALGDLGFVYNATAMSDICLSPSLSETYGFFDRPNAFNIVHDLFPIFSQSKISSYADIIYPSPWYWFEKVPYDEKKDFAWTEKEDQLYWRGSTTGGFSRNGGWRRQHRQRFVQKINARDQAQVLVNTGTEERQRWTTKEVSRGEYKELMDVYFSHIGQCDDGDCNAQKEFFEIKEYADQEAAFKYKYVLDIDGNAFSGRFYAFLKSRSLVYKWAVFREWHYEWLRPWAHYVPLSLKGDDWLEAVRWFGEDDTGKREAERVALMGRSWANKVVRHEDMEVWLFRLLLEYGRVIDDDRQNIGFLG
ncbi:hypothetical protein B0H66DRAFT_474246 [Apodospora peruviana]|uniref:Glycosyl transferase CAP10 domain-containing protein n=1 Tax=Apodospora peruviana TaxID=516989 RepID=A0AAE0ICL5_9PEZI|nr:hypothetical protein B0H66DRAFT_474246 [Apodospora peruviana]